MLRPHELRSRAKDSSSSWGQYLRGSDRFYVGTTRIRAAKTKIWWKIIQWNEKYLPWRRLANKIDTVKDPDPAAGEIQTLVIGHQKNSPWINQLLWKRVNCQWAGKEALHLRGHVFLCGAQLGVPTHGYVAAIVVGDVLGGHRSLPGRGLLLSETHQLEAEETCCEELWHS